MGCSPKLLNSRQNMLLLHIAIVDLSVGLFYCPLTADYYIRGQWTHGCDSFFVWFIFSYPQVISTQASLPTLLSTPSFSLSLLPDYLLDCEIDS